MLKFLKIFKFVGGTNSKSFGIGVVIIVLGVLLVFSKKDNQNLRNEIASLRPDTVFVKADSVVKEIDTLKLVRKVYIPGEIVVDTEFVGDTVYIEQIAFDTLIVYQNRRLKCKGDVFFSDKSNKFVSIDGVVDYPYGRDVRLIYTTKFWRDHKTFSLSGNVGGFLAGDKFLIGVGPAISYKRLGFSYLWGKDFQGITIGYRLF